MTNAPRENHGEFKSTTKRSSWNEGNLLILTKDFSYEDSTSGRGGGRPFLSILENELQQKLGNMLQNLAGHCREWDLGGLVGNEIQIGLGKLGNELKMGLGSWEMRTWGGEINYKTVWEVGKWATEPVWEVGNKLGNTTKWECTWTRWFPKTTWLDVSPIVFGPFAHRNYGQQSLFLGSPIRRSRPVL